MVVPLMPMNRASRHLALLPDRLVPASTEHLDASYISHEAANAIVGSYESMTFPDDPAEVWIDGGVLASVNQFLDFVLKEVLAAARSAGSLPLLRGAVKRVVQSRLADESILEAESELETYSDEFDLTAASNINDRNGGKEFDLERVFQGMRAKCMVYSQLGNVEETHIRSLKDRLLVDPTCAIFLMAALEFMGEHSLLVAARRAQGRMMAASGRIMAYPVTRGDLKIALTEDEQFKEVWRQWLRSEGAVADNGNKAVSFRDTTSPFLANGEAFDESVVVKKLAPEHLVDRSRHNRMSTASNAANGFSVRSRPQSMIEDLRSHRLSTVASAAADKRYGVILDDTQSQPAQSHSRTVSSTSDDAASTQSFTIMYPQRESLRTLRVNIPPSNESPPIASTRSPDRPASRPSSALSGTPPRTPTRHNSVDSDGDQRPARRRSSSSTPSEAYREQAHQRSVTAQHRRSRSNTPTKGGFDETYTSPKNLRAVSPASALVTSATAFPAVSPIPEQQNSPGGRSTTTTVSKELKQASSQSTVVDSSASPKASPKTQSSPKEKLKKILRSSSTSSSDRGSQTKQKISGLGIDIPDGEATERRRKFDNLMSTRETVKVTLTPQPVRSFSPLNPNDQVPSTMTSTQELANFFRTTGPEDSKDEHKEDTSHVLPPVRRISKYVPIVVPSSTDQPIQHASSPPSSMKMSMDSSTAGLLNPTQRQLQSEQNDNDEFEADLNEILYGNRHVTGRKKQNGDGPAQSESLVDFLRNTGPEVINSAPNSNPKRWGTLGKRVKSVPTRSLSAPHAKSQPLVQRVADIDLNPTINTIMTPDKVRVKGMNSHVTQLSYSPKKKSLGSPGSSTTSEFSNGSRKHSTGSRKLSTGSRTKRRGPTSETTSLAEFLRNTSPEDFHKPTPIPADETTLSTFATGARRRAAHVRRNIMRRISSAPTKAQSEPRSKQAQHDASSLSMATGGVTRSTSTHIPLLAAAAAASTTQVK